MTHYYSDLHVHIGRTSKGQPVKITASPQLTIENIVKTAKMQKGLDLVGIIDGACSGVLADLKDLIEAGKLVPLSGGGYNFAGVVLFFGSEVELVHPVTAREAHFLAFFPSYETLAGYADKLASWVTNSSLSTQRLRLTPDHWLELVKQQDGVAIAAHAFTPHKGVYGNCVSKLDEMFAAPGEINALELGLSANTVLASSISDTHAYPYIANSDAHSLGTLGREFTVYEMPELNFTEWKQALTTDANGVAALYGLDPRLGKYYRTFCPKCEFLAEGDNAVITCPVCDSKTVMGVWDRIFQIADWSGQPVGAPYHAHVPLNMIPGVGPKTYTKLIKELGTEIEILYKIPLEEIRRVAGSPVAGYITRARAGTLVIEHGGGGKYGRVAKNLER